MDDQLIIVCDDQGNPTGEYISKEKGHRGKGRRHLAICVLLVNSQGKVVLQRRKHRIFDNLWDLTGATNNLRIDNKNEDFIEACKRCLKEEYGIEGVEVEKMGKFNYFAQDGKYCENEHCAILIGEYDGEIKPNPKDAYEVKWINKKGFMKDLENNPDSYTPWSIKAVKILKEKGFFNIKKDV